MYRQLRFEKCGDIEGSLILHLGASDSFALQCGPVTGDMNVVSQGEVNLGPKDINSENRQQ